MDFHHFFTDSPIYSHFCLTCPMVRLFQPLEDAIVLRLDSCRTYSIAASHLCASAH